MTLETNKDIARRFIDEVFAGDKAAVDELVADDFVPHSWGDMPPGRDSLKQALDRVYSGISDHGMTIDDMIAEDDRVAIRLRSHARHTGTFMGIPATGRRYEITETHILRLRDGKVVEHWRDGDMLGLMQQLGALPAPGGAARTDREPAAAAR